VDGSIDCIVLIVEVSWLSLRVVSCLHSAGELGELVQWLCHDDSIVNTATGAVKVHSHWMPHCNAMQCTAISVNIVSLFNEFYYSSAARLPLLSSALLLKSFLYFTIYTQ